MAKKRVDIELDENVLEWAGVNAVTLGISRRAYLKRCIERLYHDDVVFKTIKKILLTPEECTPTQKFKSDE